MVGADGNISTTVRTRATSERMDELQSLCTTATHQTFKLPVKMATDVFFKFFFPFTTVATVSSVDVHFYFGGTDVRKSRGRPGRLLILPAWSRLSASVQRSIAEVGRVETHWQTEAAL